MLLCIQRVSVITLLMPAAKTLGCANCFIKKTTPVIRGELDEISAAAPLVLNLILCERAQPKGLLNYLLVTLRQRKRVEQILHHSLSATHFFKLKTEREREGTLFCTSFF
jgi:hypothetical protein